MKYKSGYKYQLARDETVFVGIFPEVTIKTDYLLLREDGFLTAKKGYCWDGASGCAIDTDTFMQASLFHDALYQLMRYSLLDQSCKDAADLVMYDLCIKNGMFAVRAWYAYRMVQRFGKSSTDPKNKRKVLEC